MKLKFKFVFFLGVLIAGSLPHRGWADEPPAFDLSRLSTADQEELSKINQELDQLEDLKNRYRASAARYEDQALRWQFEQNLKQEARRSAQRADLDREMERQIQQRIDFLEARKAEILAQ